MSLAIEVKENRRVDLGDYDPSDTAGLKKEEAVEQFTAITQELGELQEVLYAAGQNSVLIILQGMDTSGKDGTIKGVMDQVNPQGCRVESFKVPTEEELAHDFLWRVHKVAPPLGMMTIFNRSHYEDVLVVRVHNLKPEAVWQKHYHHINHFERLLNDSGTIILKFFLHISKDEQRKRLEARELDTEKAWKLAVGDWRERELWHEYRKAYEDALSKCSTDIAPWYIIPADKKWFRNLAVAEAIIEKLRPYRPRWEVALAEMAKERLAELQAFKGGKEPKSQ
jgi:PPK2 family polyphosphate:nucleotide phosphotransferase